jgi:hypothetical protein
MSPEGDKILALTAQRLPSLIAAESGPAFAAGAAGLMGILLGMVAQEYERGADLRVNENKDIRALFAKLAPQAGDRALKAELEKAAQESDSSFTISALNKNNYALRRLLTRLHAHVEELPGAAGREAEKAIWALLKTIAARRMVMLGGAG